MQINPNIIQDICIKKRTVLKCAPTTENTGKSLTTLCYSLTTLCRSLRVSLLQNYSEK
jgi:hypothetical protein